MDGSFVTPPSGTALDTVFTMHAGWDWEDEDLPLSYAFAVRVPGVDEVRLLTAPSAAPSATSLLPAGPEVGNSVFVVCTVRDGLDASAEAESEVSVAPLADVTKAAVDEKLGRARDLKNADMLLQAADAISSHLNSRIGRRRAQERGPDAAPAVVAS